MTNTEFIQLYSNFSSIEMDEEISFRIKKLLFELPTSEVFNKSIAVIKETDITKEQALYDIKDFFLAIKYCYSGYEYFSRIVNFDNLKSNLVNLITNCSNENITSIDLGEMLSNQIFDNINDGHFSIVGFGNGNFAKQWRAYVTSIVVEKDDNNYKVIKGNTKLPIGTLIEGAYLQRKLLPTLMIGKNNDCFLIGVYSKEEINFINVGDIMLNTHIIYADKYEEENCDYIQKYEGNKDYNLFLSKSYMINQNVEEILKEYYKIGLKCRNKDVTVFDIAGNRGGNSRFPQNFIKGLNDYAYWQSGCAVLVNPIFNPNTNSKSYSIESYPEEYEYFKSKYNGTLYVIMNKWTGSSGEAAVSYANSCKNVILMGSATGGIGTFGDAKLYRLTNSKILFHFGNTTFYMPNYEEGKGFIPHFWIDSKNPLNYLKRYLK